MKKITGIIVLALILMLPLAMSASEASFTMPQGLQTIENEAFMGDNSIKGITVNDGCESIGLRAFYGCFNLNFISVPRSVQQIGRYAFTGCNNMTMLCWKDSSAHQYALQNRMDYWLYDGAHLNSAEVDGMGTVRLSWSSAGTGSKYTVYERASSGSERVVAVTGNTSADIDVASAGTYTYSVCPVITVNGQTFQGQRSNEESVVNNLLWTKGLVFSSAVQTGEGTIRLSWKGISPIDSYTIYENQDGAYQSIGNTYGETEIVLQNLVPGKHMFTVRGEYLDDDDHTWYTDYAPPMAVEVKQTLTAPELVFEDPALAFASTQAEAAVYKLPAVIDVRWNPVQDADSYTITLDRLNGSTFSNVLTESDFSGLGYTFEGTLFSNLTTQTVFRFGIMSNGALQSPVKYSYFAVKPQNTAITVDGKTSLRWDHSKKHEGSRTFTVASELNWTATCSADWVRVQQNPMDQTVTVTVQFMAQSGSRNATVTLSNGSKTADIKVYQQHISSAPSLSFWGEELSVDPDHPTQIPAGGFTLNVNRSENSYASLELSEKQGSSYVSRFTKTISSNSQTYDYQTSGVTFSSGKTFRIRTASHIGTGYLSNESAEDAHTRDYYFCMVSDGYKVLVNGAAESVMRPEYSDAYSETVMLNAKNNWQATSDQSWLTWEQDGIRDEGIRIMVSCAANTSGKERTGHITFTSGASTAKLTVIQPNNAARILSPSNLSKSESSPTVINTNYFTFEYFGTGYVWEYKNGSSWVESDSVSYNQTNHRATEDGMTQRDTYFVNGKTYRLTIKNENDGTSAVYYVKRNSTSTAYVKVSTIPSFVSTNGDAYAKTGSLSASAAWKATSDASWLTVSPSSGAKTNGTSITINATANNSGTSREGTIKFTINNIQYNEVHVRQSAGGTLALMVEGCPAADSTLFAHAPGKSVTQHVMVYTNNEGASITTNVSWITTSPASSISGDYNVSVKLAENTTGARRSGTLTFTNGSAKQTLNITQEPNMGMVSISSPALSTTSSTPTTLANDGSDLTIKWSHINNAVQYRVTLSRIDDSGKYVKIINDTGSGIQAVTLPADWFDVSYSGVYKLQIYPRDTYGNEGNVNSYYFSRAVGNVVYLNRKTAQTWALSNELADFISYSVASSSTWTAEPSQSWITLSTNSGASGETLTINVSRNAGAARSGTVTVKCGTASAKVTISQPAALTLQPEITAPDFGDSNLQNPADIGIVNNTLTVKWKTESQVKAYKVKIAKMRSLYSEGDIADSGSLHGVDTYTFSNLQLEEGQIYRLQLERVIDYNPGSDYFDETNRYFVIVPQNAFVEVLGIPQSRSVYYGAADGDSLLFQVNASGNWNAEVSDSEWMVLSRSSITSLPANHEDYAVYYGKPGGEFTLSLMENTTGSMRTGTVIVSTPGGTSQVVTVKQEANYTLPEITSPKLGTSDASSTEVQLDNIPVAWSEGEGNNGNYTVNVFEKSGSSSYNTQVWSSGNLSMCHTVIPASVLKENTYYCVRIQTVMAESNTILSSKAFFHTGSVNEFALSVQVDWSEAAFGGYVSIMANASGGAGDYRYSYYVYCDNRIELATSWDTIKHYQFRPQSSGNYKVLVYAKDSSGQQLQYEESWQKTDTNVISVAVANHYNAVVDNAKQVLRYNMISNGSWTAEGMPEWVTINPAAGVSGMEVTVNIAANTGVVRDCIISFQCESGIVSDLTITQGQGLQTEQISIQDQDAEVTVGVFSPLGTPMENADVIVYVADIDYIVQSGKTGNDGYVLLKGLKQNTGYRFYCIDNTYDYDKVYAVFEKEENSLTLQAKRDNNDYIMPLPDGGNMPQIGGSLDVIMDSARRWSAETEEAWIALEPLTGDPGDVLKVTVTPNTEKYRVGKITLNCGTTIYEMYIRQAGSQSWRLDSPTITYPVNDGDSVPFGDITVTWEAVENAEGYVVSLRDTDTDELMLHHLAIGNVTEAVLDSQYFEDNRSYRVAVGALPYGATSEDPGVGWCEREFIIPEFVNEAEPEFYGKVFELQTEEEVTFVQSAMNKAMMSNDMGLVARSIQGREDLIIHSLGDCEVNVYHLQADNNWEYVCQVLTDKNGEYRVNSSHLIPGDRYKFFIDYTGFSRLQYVDDLIYTAEPGVKKIDDVYLFSNELGEQVEALRQLGKFDVSGIEINGLMAEYFAFKNKDEIFVPSNKRNEKIVSTVDFSWKKDVVDNGSAANKKISYQRLLVYPYDSERSGTPVDIINYVPYKFGARFSGYVKLQGSPDPDVTQHYQLRVRGDDGVSLQVFLSDYEALPPERAWRDGWHTCKKNLKDQSYFNGTVLAISIEYYNRAENGEANLIFEYSINKGKTWQVVPKEWLYPGTRTVEIISSVSGEVVNGIDYAKRLAESDTKLKYWKDNIIADELTSIAEDLTAGGIDKAYRKGSVFYAGGVLLTGSREAAEFLNRQTGKDVAKAFYEAVFDQPCKENDEKKIWTRVSEKLAEEYDITTESAYELLDKTVDSIGTVQMYLGLLKAKASSNSYIESKYNAILEQYKDNVIEIFSTLGENSGKGTFKGLFELQGKEREEIEDDLWVLDCVKAAVIYMNETNKLMVQNFGTEDSSINRAMLSLMYAEQERTPDIFEACLKVAEADCGYAIWRFYRPNGEKIEFTTRSRYEEMLNNSSNGSINRLVSQFQGINLETLIYKDFLKITLDAAYEYYKLLLGNPL